MSNQIDANGITIETLAETLDAIINGTIDVAGLKQIYGADINTDSDTPDGQQINIYALAKQDILNLIVQNYNAKDPDQAVGVALDFLLQLCGIVRREGTFTQVLVDVTVDDSITLDGIDTDNPYTVADSAGTQFELVTTEAVVAGVHNLLFQAKDIGSVQVLANTITVPISIILGVTSINNPTVATTTGIDEETDAELRIRRQQSVALPAKGYFQSLLAGLLNIDEVTSAQVFENNTNAVDADGIAAHGIWVIVLGGTDEDIANIIYLYRNAGCAMTGAESVDIIQIDSSIFEILFDRPTAQDLYIDLVLESKNGLSIDTDFMKEQIVARYILGVNEVADSSAVVAIVADIDPDLVASEVTVSDDGAVDVALLETSAKDKYFVNAVARITIT